MDLRVLYHDHCFDGACSAALFTRFHRECMGTATSFSYHGLVHRAAALFEEAAFGEGENAIVDFKYSRSPKVTWWFDHHLSAFESPEDRYHFEEGQANGSETHRKFYDASSISCTSLIARVATETFGFDAAPFADLLHWADIVDGAKYESAEAAVGMAEPAMKLTLAIESSPDKMLTRRLIPLLTEMPLDAVLHQSFVQEQLGPLLERHRATIMLLRERASQESGVLTFDIIDQPVEGYNKFIPYYLHPDATYVVGLSRSASRTKISVGTNPWTLKPAADLINLAAICERYGGGGHARIGAISFPPDRLVEARAAAAEIAEELHNESASRVNKD